jgi:hypothetical protein
MARFYGIFLITTLILVSGFIAYVGDIVGRRMGRRRLTIFGLRPRHTAIVISVLAGMVITLVTLTIAMLVSREVRDGLTNVGFLREQYAGALHEVKLVTSTLKDVQSRRRQAESELRDAAVELKVRADELARGRASQAVLNRELGRTRSLLGAERSRLVQARRDLDSVRTELTARTDELKTTNASLTQARTDLDAAKGDLDAAHRALDRAWEASQREYVRMEQERTSLETQLSQLRTEAAETVRGLAALTVQEVSDVRSRPVVIGAQEELDRLVIPADQSREATRAQLEEFVASLDAIARKAGATPDAEGHAALVTKPILDQENGKLLWLREGQVLDRVADTIAQTGGGVVVRAISVHNTLKGEQVMVDFELYRNRLLFHKGEELAKLTVRPGLSTPEVVAALARLLRDEVGGRARTASMMPKPSPGAVALFGGGGSAVGEVSFEELWPVVESIRKQRREVSVIAQAAQDAWTAGPLRVKLVVVARPAVVPAGRHPGPEGLGTGPA